MADQTPNHDLNLYETGDTDWSHRPDMETIEQRLVIRDEEDSLDSYTPHDGALFIATDTGVVYDGDGGDWQKAALSLDTGAALWNGYELVFNDDSPETDQYIRFETE